MRPTEEQLDTVIAALKNDGHPVNIGEHCGAKWAAVFAIEWAAGREPTGEYIPEWIATLLGRTL